MRIPRIGFASSTFSDRLFSSVRVLSLVAVCSVQQFAWSQSAKTGGQQPDQTVVTYGSETLTRGELNQMVQAQKLAMQQSGGQGEGLPQDLDVHMVYAWLRDEALHAAADEFKVKPDEKEIRKQEQELRKQLTAENWQKIQAGAQFAVQSVERYREGLRNGAKNDTQLRNTIWQELGGERNSAGVPRQAFDQTLSACGRDDKAYQELKNSIPKSVDDAVARAREEFAEASRLMRVHDRITGQVQVTDEEVARAKQAIPPQGQQEMNKAPGGFKGALVTMKKQHMVDEWLRPRIVSQARFADKTLERRFRAMLDQAEGQTGEQQPAAQARQQQSPRPAATGARQAPSQRR